MTAFRTYALMVGLAITGTAPAQTAAPQKVYSNKASFALPVKLSDRDMNRLAELKFCVRPIVPGKPAEWFLVESASPTKSKFSFEAHGDGEYWFQFVTVDKQGNSAPADLDREKPALIVVVDTTLPDVDVRPMTAASGETFLQATVRDHNADPASLKLEVPTRDKGWKTLEPLGQTTGVFRVPDPAILKGVVRATAVDLAKNKSVREIDLTQPIVPTRALAPAVPVIPSQQETPAIAAAQRSVERVATQTPAPPVASPSALPPATSVPRMLLNSNRVSLDYALETSAISRVEGYFTRDSGRTWFRLGDDADRRSPFEFELPEDGVYGVALVVGTAGRPAVPPVAGEQPDCWIEVDSTKPVIQMREIALGTGEDAGMILVSWAATDANLATNPVNVWYATVPEGPWLVIEKGLKAEGAFRWPVPVSSGGRVYLRVEAADRAGNVARWETREPVILETGRAKARVLGASAKP